MNRRGFLTALLTAPLVPIAVALAEKPRSYTAADVLAGQERAHTLTVDMLRRAKAKLQDRSVPEEATFWIPEKGYRLEYERRAGRALSREWDRLFLESLRAGVP